MRSTFLAVLATLVGLALVVVGIYGLVKGDDDDDKPSTATSAPAGATPTFPDISPSAGECDQVAERDPRLAKLDDLDLRRTDSETGSAQVNLICNGGTVVLTMQLANLKAAKTTSYNAWLYNSGSDAEHVGLVIGSDHRALGSVTIGPETDTTRYGSLVLTRVPFGEQEERPRRIVFRARL